MTDPLGQSQVLPYLVGLSAKGWKITLLSCEKPDRLAAGRERIEQICADAGIEWLHTPYTKRPPVLSTFMDVWRLTKLARGLHREKKFALVHCRSYLGALVGQSLHRRFGLPYIFDMRGFWADERVEGGTWNLQNPLYRLVYQFFKRKEKQFLTEAAHVISLTENAKREIHAWHLPPPPPKGGAALPVTPLGGAGGDFPEITVIPCCADFAHFDFQKIQAQAKTELRQKLGIPADALVLNYLGSIGTCYALPEMLQFFKIVLERRPTARLFFVTLDAAEPILAAARRLEIPENQVIIRPAKREEVPLFTSVADVSLIFIYPSFARKASSPTKNAELLGLGIPLICTPDIGDTEEMLDETGAGILLRDLSDASLRAAAEQLEQVLGLDKNRLRTEGQRLFSLEMGVERYDEIYRGIVLL